MDSFREIKSKETSPRCQLLARDGEIICSDENLIERIFFHCLDQYLLFSEKRNFA